MKYTSKGKGCRPRKKPLLESDKEDGSEGLEVLEDQFLQMIMLRKRTEVKTCWPILYQLSQSRMQVMEEEEEKMIR